MFPQQKPSPYIVKFLEKTQLIANLPNKEIGGRTYWVSDLFGTNRGVYFPKGGSWGIKKPYRPKLDTFVFEIITDEERELFENESKKGKLQHGRKTELTDGTLHYVVNGMKWSEAYDIKTNNFYLQIFEKFKYV